MATSTLGEVSEAARSTVGQAWSARISCPGEYGRGATLEVSAVNDLCGKKS